MRVSIRQTIRRNLWLSLIILVYTAFFQAMYCWMRYDTISAGVDLITWLYSLLVNYIPILVLSFGIMAICRHTLRIKSLGKKIAIDMAGGIAMLVGVNYLFKWTTGMDFNWGGSIFNGMIVMLGVEFWFLSRQKQNALLRENLLTQENMAMRYEIQKAYVNPHFLYNTLDMLSALIEEVQRDEALSFIMKLTSYYRTMTRKINMPLTTLSEEIEMVRNYLDIVNHHHGDCIRFQIEGNNESDPTVVPFSLQLLVENALKHNRADAQQPMTITLSVEDAGITVSNNRNPKLTIPKGTGLGLNYLKNIYSYHGKDIAIDDSPIKFAVTLPNLSS